MLKVTLSNFKIHEISILIDIIDNLIFYDFNCKTNIRSLFLLHIDVLHIREQCSQIRYITNIYKNEKCKRRGRGKASCSSSRILETRLFGK